MVFIVGIFVEVIPCRQFQAISAVCLKPSAGRLSAAISWVDWDLPHVFELAGKCLQVDHACISCHKMVLQAVKKCVAH